MEEAGLGYALVQGETGFESSGHLEARWSLEPAQPFFELLDIAHIVSALPLNTASSEPPPLSSSRTLLSPQTPPSASGSWEPTVSMELPVPFVGPASVAFASQC